MELNLDKLRAERARQRPSALVVDGRTYALRRVLSVSTGLLLAEAQDAAQHGRIAAAADAMRAAVGELLADPTETDDLLRAVEYDELTEVLGSFYPEAPGASSPPSANGGPSAKPTAPATTGSTSVPPASVPTP